MYIKKQMKTGIFSLSKRRLLCGGSSGEEFDAISTTSTDDASSDDEGGSLHVSSLHKWSSHSVGTDCYSYSSMASIPSILSKPTSLKSSNRNKSSTKKKKVSIHDHNAKWTMVESYLPFSDDLWWSKEECQQRLFDICNVLNEYSQKELCSIRQYATAYHNARTKSSISTHHDASCSVITSKSKINLSNDDYQIIVRGKENGWDGLEKFIFITNDQSNLDRTKIVATIVRAHRKLMRGNSKSNSLDSSSKHSIKNDPAQSLRSLAKSLTSSDRSWAVVMGKADREAVLQ